jgi:large subunit ribosomal protein L25
MERVTLTAETREPNKGVARRLRTSGRIPGVLYGKSVKPIPVHVDRRALEKATKTHAGMNVMIDLTVEGGDSGLAFIRDYQADPFKRDFTHVDFQAISLDEDLHLEIPIKIVGEAIGVKEGGVLVQQRHTLEISAKPDAIPDVIEIDISGLDINDSIHADEIKLPAGVTFPHSVNFSVVAVVPPTKEEVAAAVGVEGVAGEGAAAEGAAAAPAAGAEKKEGAEAKKE